MSYPQGGYQQQPQQPWQGGGQPGQQGGGYGYPQESSGSPAAAVIGGLLGAAVGVLLIVAGVGAMNTFTAGGASFGDLPGEVITIVIGLYAVGAIMLIGALLMFVRKVAGAFVVLIGAILSIALILLEPTLLSSVSGGDAGFGDYLKSMFQFGGEGAPSSGAMWLGCQAIALVASVLALIISVIPPSLNWLRGGSADSYGGYQQQGW